MKPVVTREFLTTLLKDATPVDLRIVGRTLLHAALVGLETYSSGSPELESLLTACGGSFPRLVGALKTLRPESFSAPHDAHFGAALAPLTRAGCR